ncbi:MAG: MCE family protein, partial [Armatimonadota bacterium]
MRSGAEVKVGLVVVTALVALGAIVYYFIGMYAQRVGYPLEVEFERAEVRTGDSVVMAGVPVGRVESVGLTENNRALVRLRIRPGVTVREGYGVHIVPGAILGEKFLEIRPGPPERAGAALPPGARVDGQPYVRIEDLVADAQGLLARLTEAVESATQLIQDEEVRTGIEQVIVELGQTAHDMGELARALRSMAAETRPQVQAVLANVEAVTDDLHATSSALSRTAEETEIPAEMEAAARRLRIVTERIDDIAAQFQEMARDPEMKELALATVRNLHETSDRIREASEDIQSAVGEARAAAAAVAEASQDVPAITASMREASANIRDASVEIKGLARRTRRDVGAVTGQAAETAREIGEWPPLSIGVGVDGQYLTRDDRWWIDANLDLSARDRLLRIGVADVGESDRLNLQLGQPLGPGRVRYGVVESKAGLAYDWPLAPWFTLSAEAFDPNDLRANVFGYWGLPELEGW